MSSSTQTSNTAAGPAGVPTRGGIVVGVDGSASAESAARWAADEAHRRELPLTIVHAVHLPDALTAPLEPHDHPQHRRAGDRVVLGVAELIRDPQAIEHAHAHGPEPWATGRKEHLIRIPLSIVSGRKIDPWFTPDGTSRIVNVLP